MTMARSLWGLILTGILLLVPCGELGAQIQPANPTPYGWNQPIHPTTVVPSPMSPPVQAVTYAPDPYGLSYVPPAATLSSTDPGSGSLWTDGSLFNSPFDFEPVNTFLVGDHIVVRVADNFRSRDDTRYKNETDSEIDLSIARYLFKEFSPTDRDFDIDVQAEEEYEGKSRGDIRSQLTVEIQTEVKKVLPDGRLLIEGRTSRIIGRDIKQVLITGILQPEDVDYDTRSVDGSKVLDMQVKWEGNGPGPNVMKPGFVHRFLDYIPIF
jgi:flagellar basal body L-ring protein FlgH